MSTLGTAKRSRGRGRSRGGWLGQLDVNALTTKKLHQFSPMGASRPISPQDGMRSRREGGKRWRRRAGGGLQWPENGTDPTGFLGGTAIPLTLLPQQARTAMADAGGIDHPQAAIVFATTLLGIEGEAGGTAKGAIGLGSEVGPCKASHAGDGPLRRPVGYLCLL